MKSKFFLSIGLVVTLYCSNLFANISPDTLTGDFKVGQCTIQLDRATITQQDGLFVALFKDNQINTITILLADMSSSSVDIEVVASGFTISNRLKDKNLNVVKTVKIARSASGGRVRIVELDNQDQKYFECVLYKK